MNKKLHVIILAAGKGSRLAGVMPPYFKPLMTINGECLVVRTIKQVHEVFVGASYDVTVVVAPENTLPICQVLNDAQIDANVVVQRQPAGPGAAVLTALNDAEHTLVLMGDNLMDASDIAAVAETVGPDSPAAVGGKFGVVSVENLTRFRTKTSFWVEKVPMTAEDAEAFAWVGPFRCRTIMLRSALLGVEVDSRGELPIGPIFNHIGKVDLVEVDCTDIGVISS